MRALEFVKINARQQELHKQNLARETILVPVELSCMNEWSLIQLVLKLKSYASSILHVFNCSFKNPVNNLGFFGRFQFLFFFTLLYVAGKTVWEFKWLVSQKALFIFSYMKLI